MPGHKRLHQICVGAGLASLGAAIAGDPPLVQENIELVPSQPDGNFGTRIALSQGTLLAGASGVNTAFLFDTAKALQVGELTADPPDPGAFFGMDVAIDGNLAVVGAGFADDLEGAAFVYDLATGEQLHKLSVGSKGVWFGSTVAIRDGLTAIGSPGDDTKPVFVFDALTGLLRSELHPGNLTAFSGYANEIAMGDGIVAVGAPKADLAGVVFVFNATTGQFIKKLIPGGADNDFFGSAIAIDDGLLVVGRHGSLPYGTVHVYDVETLTEIDELRATDFDDYDSFDEFGLSVAIRDGVIAITAPGADDGDGAAYLYDAKSLTPLAKMTPNQYAGGYADGIATGDGVVVVGGTGKCYLFQIPVPPPPCADLTGDSLVGSEDLSLLLAVFGAGSLGDIDGDGDTDSTDLNLLLATFGGTCTGT